MFGIGFLLYWFPFFAADADGALMIKPIGETRIMGVLQRIALCYFISVLTFRFSRHIIIFNFRFWYWRLF